jgi:hypothetical protein
MNVCSKRYTLFTHFLSQSSQRHHSTHQWRSSTPVSTSSKNNTLKLIDGRLLGPVLTPPILVNTPQGVVRVWEDISEGKSPLKVRCVNEIDDEAPPQLNVRTLFALVFSLSLSLPIYYHFGLNSISKEELSLFFGVLCEVVERDSRLHRSDSKCVGIHSWLPMCGVLHWSHIVHLRSRNEQKYTIKHTLNTHTHT